MVQSQGDKQLTIAGLARAGNVGVETVRFYQRRGLLDEPERRNDPGSAPKIRRYGDEHVQRLRFIRSAQAAGFSLEEIRELLELDAIEDRPRALVVASERLVLLDRKIAELQAIRQALRKLVDECSKPTGGPCPILESFERR